MKNLLFVLAVLVAFGLAGCGGLAGTATGSGTSGTGTGTTTNGGSVSGSGV